MNNSPQANSAYVLIAMSLNFIPPSKLLEGTLLTESSLVDKEKINISDAIRIVHNLNKYSDTPNWPAILGQHLGVATHGPVGYASISAPTLGKALSTFIEWSQIRYDSYAGNIIEQEDCFEIVVRDTTGDEAYQAFFFEAFMRAFEVLITLIMGRAPCQETELHMIIPATSRKQLMQESYNSRLYFGATNNKLIVPKTLWFMPSPLYDKDSYEFNLRKCQQLLDAQNAQNHIDTKVRQLIRKHFEQCIVAPHSAAPPPTQIEICKSIHITERTLIRKLKTRNTAYKQILEEERKAFSVRLLADAKYTIFNIAEILGYRESANFCRAFKNWYKQSPSAFRRNPKLTTENVR